MNYRYNKQIVDMFLCSKLSVGNCHSAEKRNPMYATSIINTYMMFSGFRFSAEWQLPTDRLK